jgi:hypothetical protein
LVCWTEISWSMVFHRRQGMIPVPPWAECPGLFPMKRA